MKYLIVSDIHGSLTNLSKVLEHYHAMRCDMLLILGDILNYGPRNGLPDGLNPLQIAEQLNAMADEVMAVRGNCDSEVDQMLLNFPILSDYLLLCDGGKKIFLTHGHLYNKVCPPKGHFDAIFHGHTHLPGIEKIGTTTWCNTGSSTFPKGENPPTFCTLENNTICLFHLNGEKISEATI